MLPTGHIEFTWAALNLLQRRQGVFPEADYRLIALVALAPDFMDKPLALTLYRDTNAALFWGHNLWLHLGVWAAVWIAFAVAGNSARNFKRALPYLLVFSGHLIADRMWGFQETLFYPFGAGYWHPWVHVGDPAAMLDAYLTIIRTTPILPAFEAIGVVLLVWFIRDRRLYEPDRLGVFIRTGRPAPDDLPAPRRSAPLARWLAGWFQN